jgi:uncharacterized membrane protein
MPAVQSDPKTCLKCGYLRRASDAGPEESCPSCGAIYAKVEASLRGKEAAATPAARNDHRAPAAIIQPEDIPLFVDEDRRRTTHLLYFLYLLPLGVTALMAYTIAKSIKDDYQDEIAAAHNEWQYDTLAKVIWVVAATVIFALVVGAAQGGYLLTHDETLHHFAQSAGKGLSVIVGLLYAWTLLRTLRGWFGLIRGEGP